MQLKLDANVWRWQAVRLKMQVEEVKKSNVMSNLNIKKR